jgi:transcriptional regulator with XRE-family HTH domain
MTLRAIVDSRRADELATLLKMLREQAGITQEELADRSSLSIRTISDLERGRTTTPQRRSIALLAKALGVKGDSLDHLREAARGRSLAQCPVCAARWQWDEVMQAQLA